MFVIGITGGIGSGKSSVAKILHEMGIEILDADLISHQVTAEGGSAVEEVTGLFGEEILEQGVINRKKLADVVFSDKNRLDQLSAIVHRHVIETIRNRVSQLEKKKVKVCALDVPIPVREGFLDLSDYVIVIWAKDEVRIRRLTERGMKPDEARRRMAMQMTEDEYKALASEVIRNDGSREELLEAVEEFALRELAGRGIPLQVIDKEGFNLDVKAE